MGKISSQPKSRHGPLHAGHPWIVDLTSMSDVFFSLSQPWVARMKRAMTGGCWGGGQTVLKP